MLFENEVLRDYKLTPQEIAMGKGMVARWLSIYG